MNTSSPYTTNAIPEEFRAVAAALFAQPASLQALENFAGVLGIREDYKRLISITDDAGVHNTMVHFHNNFDLLIQKTWVDKDDEVRKEKLQDKLPMFINLVEKRDYANALKEFNTILDELAYLLFGIQSHKDDFIEYIFRIDDQIGLFWWYGRQLASFEHSDPEYLRSLLAIGIGFLTNF